MYLSLKKVIIFYEINSVIEKIYINMHTRTIKILRIYILCIYIYYTYILHTYIYSKYMERLKYSHKSIRVVEF